MQEIIEQLENNPSPHDLADMKLKLAGIYHWESEKLKEIMEVRPSIWLELRKNTKSDTSADRMWQGTPKGIQETKLKIKIKQIDKLTSAINSMLKIAEGEAQKLY